MSARAGDGEDYLLVGRVRKPHGVAGEVTIAIDTDRPRQVFRPGRVLQLGDSRGEPVGRTVTIERFRPVPGGGILRLADVRKREEADPLRGQALLIAAREAQPADEGEVHYRDLVGLTARSDGVDLGRVEDVLPLPGGETLLVRGSGGREILVPFVKEMISSIDLEARVVVLALPDGLLEL